ncbi:MAG: serine/threonine-protein kinase [bacterium]|nr:protein kinase [bacterium]MBU1919087.1 protein kinase [bacterium]
MADLNDKKLGQYTLVEKIAQGGMAHIYKAKTFDSTGFERLVVIKRILPHISADPEYVEMLVDEAKIAVNFNHGNIAQVYDLGRVSDDYFIVMEYVDGKTFSQIVKRLNHLGKKIPLDILLYSFIELCRALSYIHAKKGADGKSLGVVHRDVSPQNIILSYAGVIKIIDFGVAKAKVKEGRTESGVLKGKFAYMSPEQARSDRVDWRSDIFSVGTLLWEMSTGQRLFKRQSNHETIQAIQKAKYDHASTRRSDIPKELDRIIKKALQKSPKSRYQDAGDMARDLEKLLFKLNPDFKPVYAAEFVYKLYGPEEDERNLPDHLFTKEDTPVTQNHQITPKTKLNPFKQPPIEEPTIKEIMDHTTPVVHIPANRRLPLSYFWIIFLFLFIFISGSVYVYFVNKDKSGSITLHDLDGQMEVIVNNKRLLDVPLKIKLAAEESHKIIVKKKTFKNYLINVILEPHEHKNIYVRLEKEVAELGTLFLITSPPGATVYLNNIEWSTKTPTIIKNLEVGHTYKIGLFLQKYMFITKNVTIKEPGELKLEHNFKVNFSYLSVTTNPLGAHVLLNGLLMGKTPYQNNNLAPNQSYIIELKLPGYHDEAMTVNLMPGEEKKLNFDLNLRDE